MCPRCGYRGEGVGYFTRGSHIMALIVAAMFTSWGMGFGGLVYYLFRRDYRICPRCGESWGRFGEYGAVTPSDLDEPAPLATLPGDGSPRMGWAMMLFLLAAVIAVGGIVSHNPASLGFSAAAAGGGFLLYRDAESRREARRAALISSLQLPVLRLAAERHGRLTVTEVAAHLGWTIPRAEKVLRSLDDGFRVTSEVTDEGMIVYEFRELLHGIEPPADPDH